jgi:hypothetical protein
MGLSGSALAAALGGGNLSKVKYLVQAGAPLHYVREGYTAALDAVPGRNVLRDPGLLPPLAWLVEQQVNLNAITRYSDKRCLQGLSRSRAYSTFTPAAFHTFLRVSISLCTSLSNASGLLDFAIAP